MTVYIIAEMAEGSQRIWEEIQSVRPADPAQVGTAGICCALQYAGDNGIADAWWNDTPVLWL